MIARVVSMYPQTGDAQKIISAFRLELTEKIKKLDGCINVWVVLTDNESEIYVFSLWQSESSLSSWIHFKELLDKLKSMQITWPKIETGRVMSSTI